MPEPATVALCLIGVGCWIGVAAAYIGARGSVRRWRRAGRRTPWAAVVMGYASYDIRLVESWVLQPTLVGEWVDTDTEFSKDETLRTVVGVNLLWGQHLRMLPQVEVERPLGDVGERSQLKLERYYLVVAVEL